MNKESIEKKTTFECIGCERTFTSAQGLAVHNYRAHSKKGESWNKGKVNAVGMIPQHLANPKPAAKKKPVPVARTLKFCPCCGVNIEIAEKALAIAQEMA